MALCWSRSPKHRPNFIEVIEFLLSEANERFFEVSYFSKHKSQIKQKSSSQSLHDEPSAPLKPMSNDIHIEENLMDVLDDSSVHFFPLSRTIAIPDNNEVRVQSDDENYDIDQIDEYSNADHLLKDVTVDSNRNDHQNSTSCAKTGSNSNSNCNSKQSSDGSKGSKISSTTSNGSIANGHGLHYKTTMCWPVLLWSLFWLLSSVPLF